MRGAIEVSTQPSSNRYLTAADGLISYVTIDGDMVDQIAIGYYGAHEDNTEEILKLNPGLAGRGERLPAGLVVRIPPMTQTLVETPTRKLWD